MIDKVNKNQLKKITKLLPWNEKLINDFTKILANELRVKWAHIEFNDQFGPSFEVNMTDANLAKYFKTTGFDEIGLYMGGHSFYLTPDDSVISVQYMGDSSMIIFPISFNDLIEMLDFIESENESVNTTQYGKLKTFEELFSNQMKKQN